MMNLYFLDSNGKEHLVAENVKKSNAISTALEDLKKRNANYKSGYQRAWDDSYGRMWIDVGSYTEFYILHHNFEDGGCCGEDACDI